jgi:transposase InsO family protein
MVEVLQDLLAMGGVGGEEEESGKKKRTAAEGEEEEYEAGGLMGQLVRLGQLAQSMTAVAWRDFVRRQLAAKARRLEGAGQSPQETSAQLGVSLSTTKRWLKDEWEPRKRGRKTKRATPELVKAVWRALGHERGIGIAPLKKRFAELSYRVLGAIKKTWQKMKRARRRQFTKVLQWFHPGRVWALDGTEFKRRVNGKGRRVLVMRDVSSTLTLRAEVGQEKAERVIEFLEGLFAIYGEPLVLKHDGGGGFMAKETQAFLREKGVVSLLSPPGNPEYNGGVERGMQDVKGYTEAAAECAGRPGKCLESDLVRAVELIGKREIKREGKWTSAKELYAQRTPVTHRERQHFHAVLEKEREKAREWGVPLLTPDLDYHDRIGIEREMEREAVSQTLQKTGNLNIEEVRVSLPNPIEEALIFCAG